MGNLATSQKTSQATTNQQVGVNGAGASGASGSGGVGKAASQAIGNGISLTFNTGNNKVTSTAPKSNSILPPKQKKNAVTTATTPTAATVPTTTSAPPGGDQGSGNIAVSISQTDQGAVSAGTSVSLEAISLAKAANDALLQSNTNATELAEHALQTGADVAAVAIPTYAASEIASNAINPPNFIDSGSGVPSASTLSRGEMLALVGIVLSGALLLGKKNA